MDRRQESGGATSAARDRGELGPPTPRPLDVFALLRAGALTEGTSIGASTTAYCFA